jgi:flagellar protein FliL
MTSKDIPAAENIDGKGIKPTGKKKPLMIIVAALLLLVAGGGGYLMLGSGGSAATPAVQEKPKPGKVKSLDAMTVNLADGHYLKIQVALQGEEGAAEDAGPDASRVADLIISQFSDLPIADLSSEQGRAKQKADLLAKIEKAYPSTVMDLYYTSFVMQ